jgi:hypothetical protein
MGHRPLPLIAVYSGDGPATWSWPATEGPGAVSISPEIAGLYNGDNVLTFVPI